MGGEWVSCTRRGVYIRMGLDVLGSTGELKLQGKNKEDDTDVTEILPKPSTHSPQIIFN